MWRTRWRDWIKAEAKRYLVGSRVQKEDSKDIAPQHRGGSRKNKVDVMRRHSKGVELARKLGLSESRGIEAVLKAELIAAVAREAKVQKLTHAELARRSKLPRSAVTGILSGSLQRVTLDRILKLVEAVGFVPEIKLKKVA